RQHMARILAGQRPTSRSQLPCCVPLPEPTVAPASARASFGGRHRRGGGDALRGYLLEEVEPDEAASKPAAGVRSRRPRYGDGRRAHRHGSQVVVAAVAATFSSGVLSTSASPAQTAILTSISASDPSPDVWFASQAGPTRP